MIVQTIKKIKNIIFSFFLKVGLKHKEWKKIEYFDDKWKERMKQMAKYIPENVSVIDLGCGPMWLKEYVKYKAYYPVDYKKRDDNTIVCDFNKLEFPDLVAEYAFVGGCLEYVVNFEWFIKQIAEHVNNCVISYCCIEQFPHINARRELAWVNDLSKKNIISLFTKNEMTLIAEDNHNSNSIFLFSKVK